MLLAQRYSNHWFATRTNFDIGDRLKVHSTGIDVPELLGTNQSSEELYNYTARGLLQQVSSTYGALIRSARFDAEGLPSDVVYGDAASTKATFKYDDRRRLQDYLLDRAASPIWQTQTPTYKLPPSSTTELEISNLKFTYDAMNNPKTILGLTSSAPWPRGAKPVTRQIEYDDLYRIKQLKYSFTQSLTQVSPFAHELQAGDVAPVPLQHAKTRVLAQGFHYDCKGNLTETTDNLKLAYDRSLGVMTYGEARSKPNQLLSAADGGIQIKHDEAGNLVDLRVERRGVCPTGKQQSACAERFVFDWDEIGRLSRARRWDYNGNTIPSGQRQSPKVPTRTPTWDVSYAYSLGQRVIKSIMAKNGALRHTLEIFDTLRLNQAKYDVTAREYERTPRTETAYLGGVGRLVYGPTLPSPSGNPLHMYLELSDHLGSTATVIDAETGEIVEAATYQAQGALETTIGPNARMRFARTTNSPVRKRILSLASYTSVRAIITRGWHAG
jgi:hypothetical protein